MTDADEPQSDDARRTTGQRERRLIEDTPRELDQFGPVLVLAVITISGLMLLDLYDDAEDVTESILATAISLITGLTLIMALGASGVHRRARVFAIVFISLVAVANIIFVIVQLTTDADIIAFRSDRPSPIWVAISLVTPLYVIRRLFQHRRVTSSTMMGAIAAYLLIAIGFVYLFLFVSTVQSASFFSGTDDQTSTSFAYFSLTTITTLGYGDLSPATNLGRLLATSEAVIGQVYLVTFVGMVVGLFIQQRDAD